MQEVHSEFQKRLIANVSLTGTSLEDLRQQGHPYSAERPATPSGVEPYQIHKRSGGMAQAFTFSRQGSNRYMEQLSVSFTPRAPYQASVFYGSKRMIPRNPIEGTFKEMEREKVVEGILSRHINKGRKI